MFFFAYCNNELSQPEFDGKKYILPMHTPQNIDEYQNRGYTVYARNDILKALNVDVGQVNTSEKVYELAKKVKDGRLVDINGNARLKRPLIKMFGLDLFMTSIRPVANDFYVLFVFISLAIAI